MTELLLESIPFWIIAFILFIIFLYLGLYIFSLSQIFKKAGIEPWKAIIPFYNDYLFTVEVCELHPVFYIVLFLAGTFSAKLGFLSSIIIALIKAASFYNLAIKSSKNEVTSSIFGALFSSIVTIVFGLGHSEYSKTKKVKNGAVFDFKQ